MNTIEKMLLTGVGIFVLLSMPLAFGSNELKEYAQLLNQHVKNGFVDYAAIQKSPDTLISSIKQFESVQRNNYNVWNQNDQKAFWINAYNAAVIKMVVDYYPLKKGLSWKALAYPSNSIQQIPDVWDRKVLHLLGSDKSLNDIEHKILRKQFRDPRIHFALVCASIGCPALRSDPYEGSKLDDQLDAQIYSFLSNSAKASYDKKSNILYLSPIFRWFEKDFAQTGGVITFTRKYWPFQKQKFSAKTKIKWLDYDWSLNEKR